MPAVPGFAVAPGANQIVPPVDWVNPPARIDNIYGARVCAIDADGNAIAGIRLPPIAVPLGTHTGWNVYRAQPGELADRAARSSPSPGPRRSARRPATRARRSQNATAVARPMLSRSRRRPTRWSPSACFAGRRRGLCRRGGRVRSVLSDSRSAATPTEFTVRRTLSNRDEGAPLARTSPVVSPDAALPAYRGPLGAGEVTVLSIPTVGWPRKPRSAAR